MVWEGKLAASAAYVNTERLRERDVEKTGLSERGACRLTTNKKDGGLGRNAEKTFSLNHEHGSRWSGSELARTRISVFERR